MKRSEEGEEWRRGHELGERWKRVEEVENWGRQVRRGG